MIKLTELINELEKPASVYKPGMEPRGEPGEDMLQKGFKLGKTTVNPETGTSMSDVEYLPEFDNIRRQLQKMRKEFQPFKFSSNEDIAKTSKDIVTNMTRLSQMVFALDKMIELQGKNK
jgi:hypothetical protein